MCGLFNLIQADDFHLPNGLPSTDAAKFGNAWKSGTTCEANQLTAGITIDACQDSASYSLISSHICQRLKGGRRITITPLSILLNYKSLQKNQLGC